MEPTPEKFCDITKTQHDGFLFYLNKQKNEKQTFIHDLLGQATVPLLGQYGANYTMTEVQCLVTLDYDLQNDENNSINLPDILIDFLINPRICKKNNDKNDSNQQFNEHKNKNPIVSPVKFYWVITYNTYAKNEKNIYNIVPH